jgi:hypothetical protein
LEYWSEKKREFIFNREPRRRHRVFRETHNGNNKFSGFKSNKWCMYAGYGDWKSIESKEILNSSCLRLRQHCFKKAIGGEDRYLKNRDVRMLKVLKTQMKPMNWLENIFADEILHWATKEYIKEDEIG